MLFKQAIFHTLMLAFVTVGTTSFDKLIQVIDSSEFIDALKAKGYTQLVIQLGRGTYLPVKIGACEQADIIADDVKSQFQAQFYRFKPNLDADFKRADLVISHGGAGSICEALGLEKPLIIVVNEDLMDNHQFELADAIAADGACYSCTCSGLVKTIESANVKKLQPYPKTDYSLFPEFVEACIFGSKKEN